MAPVNRRPDAESTVSPDEPDETLIPPPLKRPRARATDIVVPVVCLLLLIYSMIFGRPTRLILGIGFAHLAACKFDKYRDAGNKGTPLSSYLWGLAAALEIAAYIF